MNYAEFKAYVSKLRFQKWFKQLNIVHIGACLIFFPLKFVNDLFRLTNIASKWDLSVPKSQNVESGQSPSCHSSNETVAWKW